MNLRKSGLLLLGSVGLHTLSMLTHAAPPKPVASSPKPLLLVHDGKPQSAIVLEQPEDSTVAETVAYFVNTVKRSTGAEIPILTPGQAELLPKETVRINILPLARVDSAPSQANFLKEESYRLTVREDSLSIQAIASSPSAPDPLRPQSNPLRWAFNSILEESLGVRWLWPGELGTYVPKHSDLAVATKEVVYQPRLLIRSLRLSLRGYRHEARGQLVREAIQWAENHQAGIRGEIPMGHAFIHWWERYGATHPDYFAQAPKGIDQPFLGPHYVKLRLANPAVIDQIEQEYRAAGAPPYWNVSPNDRYGFDISEETRRWDIPSSSSPEKIWRGETNLTPRYVEFWNRIYERLKSINPDVKLSTYAYYSYYKPPPETRPLTAKCVIGLVHTYHAYDLWKAWAATGAELILRPNWWHLGADAPHIPNRAVHEYLKFTSQNGMIGMSMDSILGHWATQGINYYLVARMMTQPTLTMEEIMAEYLAAFGKGAPFVEKALAHFERLTEEYQYESDAGQLAALAASGKIANRWAKGSHQALPILWGEEAIAPAYQLLLEAEKAIDAPDSEEAGRVQFLRKGLDHLRLKRETIVLSEKATHSPSSKNLEAFAGAMKALTKLRADITEEHVIWQKSCEGHEDGHRVFVRQKDEAAALLPEEM